MSRTRSGRNLRRPDPTCSSSIRISPYEVRWIRTTMHELEEVGLVRWYRSGVVNGRPGPYRWGRHRNRHVRWRCPTNCGCIRHTHPEGTLKMNHPTPDCQCGHGHALHAATGAKRCTVHRGPEGTPCPCTGYQPQDKLKEDS